MDERRAAVASNLIRLRMRAGMTQAELGEKLNYSDKSVSKWERGDSVPDVFVLKQIADLYGVTLDYLLESEHEEPCYTIDPKEDHYTTDVITMITLIGIWTFALCIFIGGRILHDFLFWQIFVYAVPVSLTVLLVLHSVWRRGVKNFRIIAILILSVFLTAYVTFLPQNPWQLFLILIPAELVVFLCYKIKKHRKNPDSTVSRVEKTDS